jgi:Ca2+-binding RTX toxin-like protein
MKATRLLVVAVVVTLALPAAASAATVTKTGSTITYIADAQEINDVTVSLAGDVYTLNEQGNAPGKGGITVKNGGGCQVATQGTTTTATCPAAGTTLLDIETGDQGDTVKVLAPTAARILGGDGIDNLTGGDGADQILGEVGTDTLNGGGGDDTLSGGADDDTLNGGAGNDTLNGDEQNDTVNGDDGNDILRGGAGGDAMNGGNGSDTADYADRGNPLTITLDGQPGDGEAGENDNVAADVEIVNGGGGADSITGSDIDNVLNGNGGNDTLIGQGGNDTLSGGDGDDTLSGGAGADTLSGGNGSDSVSYAGAAVPVRVTLDGLAGDGAAGENDNVGADVENVTGGNVGDVLIGNAGPNGLQGGPGDDRLLGGGGADTLDGGDGNDSIQALDGAVDQVLCVNGTDGAIADKGDVLNACEAVQRTLVQVLVSKAKMRKGIVRVPVRCSAYATEGCNGSLTLKYRTTTLGKKAFKLANGAKSTLKVKLSKKAQKLLRKKRKLACVANVTTKDASGQVAKTTAKVKLTA